MNTQSVKLMSVSSSLLVSYNYSWAELGWVVGLILIVLLSTRELLRTYSPAQRGRLLRVLDAAIVPLLLLFGAVVVARVLPVLANR